MAEPKPFKSAFLLFSTLIISICSIVYELIVGSVSSYLLGNSVLQFSVTIGLYMFSMGLGSYFSKYFTRDLFDVFASVEISLGVIGGFSSLILFMSYAYTSTYALAMYLVIMVIGFFVGLEIPLLVRILEMNGEKLRDGVANIFAIDYLGGLLGSFIFPLVLLPKLGYVSVAFFSGVLNTAIALSLVFIYKNKIKNQKMIKTIAFCSLLLLVFFCFMGSSITRHFEDGLYRDQIILSTQTPYQKVVLTIHKDDLRLFLDGNMQFSSVDEYRYHEALVHIPLAANPRAEKVLLLGAGDGLATRELLKYDRISEITIVDIDKELVELCRAHPLIKKMNQGSLDSPRVKIVYEDAFVYMRENKKNYDVIIADLPDPNTETLSRLYSNLFYRLVRRRLSPDGVFVSQSTSPFYTTHAFWCINKTLELEFPRVLPYHLYIPAFGDWGFNMAFKNANAEPRLTLPEGLKLSYLNNTNIESLFVFAVDERTNDQEEVTPNTMMHPKLLEYYAKDTRTW